MTSSEERFKLIPCVYLVLRRDNKVLLLRRANTGYQDGNYGVPAGHLEGDELATSAMVREAKEEAGITINPSNVKYVHLAHRLGRGQNGQERVDIFFEATQWDGDIINTEPEKCDDLSWFPIDNLPENMIPFVRLALTDIANGIGYSEYVTEPTA